MSNVYNLYLNNYRQLSEDSLDVWYTYYEQQISILTATDPKQHRSHIKIYRRQLRALENEVLRRHRYPGYTDNVYKIPA